MTTTSSDLKLAYPVNVRLSPQKHLLYQNHAMTLNKSYSTYLRERLESQDIILDELQAMSQKIASLRSEISSYQLSMMNPGTLIEILLLLRSSSNPSQLRMIHAEVERQGLSVWEGSV